MIYKPKWQILNQDGTWVDDPPFLAYPEPAFYRRRNPSGKGTWVYKYWSPGVSITARSLKTCKRLAVIARLGLTQ